MWCKYFITHIILVAAVLWQLGSLSYHDTQYAQREWFTSFPWCDILWNKAPSKGLCHIWRTYTLCLSSGHEKNTDGSIVGWKISLSSASYGDSWVAHLLWLHLFLQSVWWWWQSWLFSASSIKFRTRRGLKSLWVYLAPHEDNGIQLLNLNLMVFGFELLHAQCT